MFEFADLHAQRWLRDVEPSGSAPEVELLRDGHEVAQQPEIELRQHCLRLTDQRKRHH
jgi:hypothetical protein